MSIEKSEVLSKLLKKAGIPHNVLNARYHDVEAQIIAEAGKPGAVTIATNMAGRGTDIKLGGNLEARLAKELLGVEDSQLRAEIERKIEAEIARDFEVVKKAGGLYVVGTERHESRRIDNQLRGRSGRQGDPGASKFFLSLEDDLMRIFGAARLDATLQKLGIEEGEVITHPWINKAVEKAQMRVEARNYDIRKHLLKYDDVMNEQRKVIYEQRHELMQDDRDCSEDFRDMRADVVTGIIYGTAEEGTPSDYWDFDLINDKLAMYFGPGIKLEKKENLSRDEAVELLIAAVNKKMDQKERTYSPQLMRYMERTVLLRLIDQYWKEHLLNLDRLRQGINLRAYGQRDPLNEYKQEAFKLFENMSQLIREEAVKATSLFELSAPPQGNDPFEDNDIFGSNGNDGYEYSDEKPSAIDASFEEKDPFSPQITTKNSIEKNSYDPFSISRNAPCPCGSGKKYKHCCGQFDDEENGI